MVFCHTCLLLTVSVGKKRKDITNTVSNKLIKQLPVTYSVKHLKGRIQWKVKTHGNVSTTSIANLWASSIRRQCWHVVDTPDRPNLCIHSQWDASRCSGNSALLHCLAHHDWEPAHSTQLSAKEPLAYLGFLEGVTLGTLLSLSFPPFPLPSPPVHPLRSHPISSPLLQSHFFASPPIPSPPPLISRPLNPARGFGGSAVSSPSGVWGGAQAEWNLVHFRCKIWHLGAAILMIFLRINNQSSCSWNSIKDLGFL